MFVAIYPKENKITVDNLTMSFNYDQFNLDDTLTEVIWINDFGYECHTNKKYLVPITSIANYQSIIDEFNSGDKSTAQQDLTTSVIFQDSYDKLKGFLISAEYQEMIAEIQ